MSLNSFGKYIDKADIQNTHSCRHSLLHNHNVCLFAYPVESIYIVIVKVIHSHIEDSIDFHSTFSFAFTVHSN